MRAALLVAVVLIGCAETRGQTGPDTEGLAAAECELGSFTFTSTQEGEPNGCPAFGPAMGSLELVDVGDGSVELHMPGVSTVCTAPMHECTASVDCAVSGELTMRAELTVQGDALEGYVTVKLAAGSTLSAPEGCSVTVSIAGERSSSAR
jgi:hypothetical protein